MADILISVPSVGAFWTPKLIDYSDAAPRRPGEVARSLTGATVHQVGTADEGDRQITGTLLASILLRDNVEDLALSSSIDCWLQDGARVYKGYIKGIQQAAQTIKNQLRFSFTFFVTEKEK